MAIGSVHLIPQSLTRERIFADQKGAELFLNNDRGFPVDGPVEAVESGIGADSQVDLVDGGCF